MNKHELQQETLTIVRREFGGFGKNNLRFESLN